MMEKPTQPLCALCSLMCPRSMVADWDDAGSPIRCDRWNRWQNSYSFDHRSVSLDDVRSQLESVRLDSNSLIWLDSCDVQTTRAAVNLAKRSGATLHVGQSSGTQAVKRVHASQGWVGTTLSEIGARSELMITIGNGALTESPLLVPRFFSPYGRTSRPVWVHITSDPLPSDLGLFQSSTTPDAIHYIDRANWYSWLCQVSAEISQDANIANNQLSKRLASSAAELAGQLTRLQQSVWIWDVDELHFETDELFIRRLLSVINQLESGTPSRRSHLLPLDMNLGRVTADETMMWLTGCSTTTVWRDDCWTSPTRFAGFALEEWQSAFNTIVLVSNVPGPRSFPNIKASLILQTQPATNSKQIQVAAVGIDCAGHLFRGDKAIVGYLPATQSTSLPMAPAVLELLGSRP